MSAFSVDPLTPSAFLARSGVVFAERTAIVDGQRSFTYREFAARARALTGVLAELGVRPGDRVAALCANSHVMLELHNGAPMAGAVLVSLNIRLAAEELGYIVSHSGAKAIVATQEFGELARRLAGDAGIAVLVAGEAVSDSAGERDEYEQRLAAAGPAVVEVADERQLLALNYTSGTTGRPKGVMYHHRGAYLQALAMAYHARLDSDSRYLWTLPMFHCNGWCFTWAVTAAGGTHVCLRAVDPVEIWRLLREQAITHYSAAPTVLAMIAGCPQAQGAPLAADVHVDAGGAPPSPALLERLAALRMNVTHLYGLTETFGPIAINQWHSGWDGRAPGEQARLRARQGVGNVIATPLRVIDEAGSEVAADGQTMGELAARGNDVMLGYYRDAEATAAATAGGWFRTGDLAVMHPDGYVELRDRRKDVIISGGENIASVEIEQVIDSHPAVLESAVVARPDEKWGEVPIAYVTVRDGHSVTAAELDRHVRASLAGFKSPKQFVFAELPKTSTGKIQKNVLRARTAGAASVE